MVDQKYEAGDIVIQQGERGDIFYVVESGAFEASIKSSDKEPAKKVAFYESGTGFGELALLYNGPRAATIECTKPGKCWGIERGLFNMIMVSANKHAAPKAEPRDGGGVDGARAAGRTPGCAPENRAPAKRRAPPQEAGRGRGPPREADALPAVRSSRLC
jgi:hypothetical protein